MTYRYTVFQATTICHLSPLKKCNIRAYVVQNAADHVAIMMKPLPQCQYSTV